MGDGGKGSVVGTPAAMARVDIYLGLRLRHQREHTCYQKNEVFHNYGI